jgi:hypothetical protein
MEIAFAVIGGQRQEFEAVRVLQFIEGRRVNL